MNEPTPRDAPTILFAAGEASGDHHTAALAAAILRRRPGAVLWGVGGREMERVGVELLHDLAGMGVMGFAEVVRHLPEIRRIFRRLVDEMDRRRPDLVVLTDYPGFNLRFAREAHRRGIPVLYHISPQVWAWASGRRHKIARIVDRMLVIFPFEVETYADTGLDVRFIGHPLVDRVTDWRRSHPDPAPRDPDLLLLLPGSREHEVRRILPPILGGVPAMVEHRPGIRLRVVAPHEAIAAVEREMIGAFPAAIRDRFEVRVGDTFDSLAEAAAGIVASGTATMECAFFGLPIAVVYRVTPLSYKIARRVVRVPHIGMVNLLAGRELVREFVQDEANPAAIAEEALRLLDDEKARDAIRSGMSEVVESLGPPGFAERGADAVLDLLP